MAKTNFEKGLELENKFAEYMRNNLRYDKTRVRAKVTQKYNNYGAEIDVISQRRDERGNKFFNLGLISLTLCACIFILSLIFFYVDIIGEFTFILLFVMGFVVGAFSILYFYLSEKFHQEFGWVECKNLKSKATISHVNKMISEIEEYRLSKDKEYKFVEYFIVSGNGFVENAIKKAKNKGIRCFSLENNKFIEEEYWKT